MATTRKQSLYDFTLQAHSHIISSQIENLMDSDLTRSTFTKLFNIDLKEAVQKNLKSVITTPLQLHNYALLDKIALFIEKSPGQICIENLETILAYIFMEVTGPNLEKMFSFLTQAISAEIGEQLSADALICACPYRLLNLLIKELGHSLDSRRKKVNSKTTESFRHAQHCCW